MSRSSPQCPHRAALTLTLLTTILLGVVPACARRTATPPAEPQVAAPEPQVAAPEDTVKAADLTSGPIEKRPQEPIASLLQGRTPGVDVVMNADGSVSVRIRGASSFYGGTEPLYVVDGSPFTPGPGGNLTGINPHDIESIEVLKGPPETTLYGVRGANGVILVTTKRPMKD
jgi:TonB-dependent SusC/RagA subfamily outer membrane receptor